jgi:hypothetical protein
LAESIKLFQKRARLKPLARKIPNMAKVSKGRISGWHGMQRHTAQELYVLADALQLQASDLANNDDLKWLNPRADRLRELAEKKQKALEHKIDRSGRPKTLP